MGERPTDRELIGRADLNDIEAILAITNTDDDAEFHDVGATIDTRFTWDYERARPRLGKLYEKAKLTQWNANDLPWQTDVDQEEVVRANAGITYSCLRQAALSMAANGGGSVTNIASLNASRPALAQYSAPSYTHDSCTPQYASAYCDEAHQTTTTTTMTTMTTKEEEEEKEDSRRQFEKTRR